MDRGAAPDEESPVALRVGHILWTLTPRRYRAAMHGALAIEEVLVRHPKRRVYLLYAGYTTLDDLPATL